MSHIVTMQTQFLSAEHLRRACDKLKLPKPVQTGKMLRVQIDPGRSWVGFSVDTETGNASYDGDYEIQRNPVFGELNMRYGLERAIDQAAALGHTCEEMKCEDGTIDLLVYAN